MYAHHHQPQQQQQPMSIPATQIAGEDDERDAAGADSVENSHHIQYEAHALDAAGNGVAIGDDVSPDGVYVAGAVADASSSQLTLSFRGQVYVFDSVTPDKVQAVLLLLGGCELSSTPQNMDMASHNQRMPLEYPVRCSQPQRAASLSRFRQKRKERCFDKKVRYSVRQEVALRMQRNKGQFTSSRKSEGAGNWETAQESGQEENPPETSCTHCGLSSKSTPMMRRGPSGPRSLCNACGLFWANRGTLKDLSKKTQDHSLTPTGQGVESGGGSGSGNPIHSHNKLVTYSNSEKTALIADH